MKIPVIVLLLFTLVKSHAQINTTPQVKLDTAGVKVTYTIQHCDFNNGYDQDWVIFRYENHNRHNVVIVWDAELYYNKKCKTCDKNSDEYHYTLELKAGEVLEGSCSETPDTRLIVFSRFNDPNAQDKTRLTDYHFGNLKIIKNVEK
jgi:hypothetical protein